MKALVCERFGGPEVVVVRELPDPVAGEGEVLVRVRATTVSSGDWRIRSRTLPRGFGVIAPLVFGFKRPRQPIFGTEFAGDVVAVGAGVSRFQVGDAVVGFTGAAQGAHAELKVMREDGRLVKKPARLSYEEAAAMSFGGTTALDFLRRGKLKAGQRLLVNGASGTVGSAAVQIGRHMGAHVTAVCSGGNAALMRKIGAHEVIDYTTTDFVAVAEGDAEMRWDVVFDAAGTAPFRRCRSAIKHGGALLLVLAPLPDMLLAPLHGLIGGIRVIAGPVSERREDVEELAALAEAGAYTPLIDGVFALADAQAAHARVDSGRKRGSVVIAMA